MKPEKGKAKWTKGISHGKPSCYHLKWAKSIDCTSCLKIRDCYRIWFHDIKRRTD